MNVGDRRSAEPSLVFASGRSTLNRRWTMVFNRECGVASDPMA